MQETSYLIFVLERIAWNTSGRNLDFPEYVKLLGDHYAAIRGNPLSGKDHEVGPQDPPSFRKRHK